MGKQRGTTVHLATANQGFLFPLRHKPCSWAGQAAASWCRTRSWCSALAEHHVCCHGAAPGVWVSLSHPAAAMEVCGKHRPGSPLSSLDAKSCTTLHLFFCSVCFSCWDEDPSQVVGYKYPRKLVSHKKWTRGFSKQKQSGFSHLPRTIPATCGSAPLHLWLPGSCSTGAVQQSRETSLLQESSRTASHPFAYLSAQTYSFAPFGCKSKSNWIFRDMVTTAPKARTRCSQCRECRVVGLGEQGGILHMPPSKACMTSIGFVPNYLFFVPSCYNTRRKNKKRKKKNHQQPGSPKFFFFLWYRSGEILLYNTWQPTEKSFFCGWVLGPNMSSRRIQKLLQTVIFLAIIISHTFTKVQFWKTGKMTRKQIILLLLTSTCRSGIILQSVARRTVVLLIIYFEWQMPTELHKLCFWGSSMCSANSDIWICSLFRLYIWKLALLSGFYRNVLVG